MLDIYEVLILPAWAYGAIVALVLPALHNAIQSVMESELSPGAKRGLTWVLGLIVSIVGVVTSDTGFSVADLLMLLAPTAIGASGSYALIWKSLRINDWLDPNRKTSMPSAFVDRGR